MSIELIIILVVVALVLLIFGIEYALKRLLDKGTDLIKNAGADKKNKELNEKGPENLADRFKQ